ncbi:hypothetical protein [Spirillospora sp. NPDC048824]|uniref:hypothetical protein n=1 Tax=Spirillospora sp. NPDC048824 TaxID=3364526 RepID=UPI0037164ADC
MDLYSAMPVSDSAEALGWFGVFFGRAADEVIGEEHLWQVGTNAWVVVDDRDVLAERVGTAMVTLGVTEFRRKASGRLPLGILRRPIPATMPGHVSSP